MAVTVAIVAAVAVVVAVVLVALGRRVRSLRREDADLARTAERRLVAPPPSPYEPSRGFRLLEPGEAPRPRPRTPPPRIDPERSYVFSEPGGPEDVVPSARRHTEEWFLSRSSHRSVLVTWTWRLLVAVAVVVVAAVLVVYYLHRGGGGSHGLGLLARALLA